MSMPLTSPAAFDRPARHSMPTDAALVASTSGTSYSFPSLWKDYQTFVQHCPGGVPRNLFGWTVLSILRPLIPDILDTTCYEHADDQRCWLRHDQLVQKRGSRPQFASHPLAQRQLDQQTPNAVKHVFARRLRKVIDDNRRTLRFGPSRLERDSAAILLAPNVDDFEMAERTRREILQLHPDTSNLHVTLAPQDAKKVIEAQWGQRHPLAGVAAAETAFGRVWPLECVLLYAPRTKSEVDQVMEIVSASIAFMTGARISTSIPAGSKHRRIKSEPVATTDT